MVPVRKRYQRILVREREREDLPNFGRFWWVKSTKGRRGLHWGRDFTTPSKCRTKIRQMLGIYRGIDIPENTQKFLSEFTISKTYIIIEEL